MKPINEKVAKAIEEYQCSGCSVGSALSCFKSHGGGVGCGNHKAGCGIIGIGRIFFGLPKGFNRLGVFDNMVPRIFEKIDVERYNIYNVVVWKYLTKDGHTIIRGLAPRVNIPFIDIILEDCVDKISGIRITDTMLEEMD